ncbi:MAG: thioesterase family protein [Planctomycetaceae bacterium]
MPMNSDIPEDVRNCLKDCPSIICLPVQWGEMDAFGHVNNIVYLRWFESGRTDLLGRLTNEVTMDGKGTGPILVSLKCDYKKQLRFPDTVYIGSRVSRIGRTSADITHTVYSQELQAVAAEGLSVIVIFDYASQRPVRVPEALKLQFDARQGTEAGPPHQQ